MKKKIFIIGLLLISTFLFLPHKKTTINNKNFNVYIKEGNTYVKSNTNEMPKAGYLLNTSESSCTNNATISQDFNTRVVSVTSTKETKCNFYFDEYNPNIMEVMNDNRYNTSTVDVIDNGTIGTGSSACTNTVAYDNTTDNNLRYVGANPCNYVTFNNETAGWRIVGIMNNVDDGTGNLETRIKLVRATSLGSYSWDSSESTVNSGYGVNDWTQADLKNELNGDYLDTTLTSNTNWYNGSNNTQTATFDYTKRLTAGAQELIGNAKWYLGGFTYSQANEIPSTMYTKERGTETYSTSYTCSDGACPRATEWTGKVALIYPSDYGYATAGGTTTNRSACIGTLSTYNSSSGETWTNSGYSDCKNNDWLKPSSGHNWLLSPYSNRAYGSFFVLNAGAVLINDTNNYSAVLPTVYLNSSVTISGVNGSSTNPFTLQLTP